MKIWTQRLLLAAVALGGATLCGAQTPAAMAPSDGARGATHDCSGMTGAALATCRELNRNAAGPAPTGAGTANDCSGMTGAPLVSCRRLNSAETEAPRTSVGTSEDCSDQIGDALKACRALNGQSTEPEGATTTGTGTTGGTTQP
jgi:hypothetical protein